MGPVLPAPPRLQDDPLQPGRRDHRRGRGGLGQRLAHAEGVDPSERGVRAGLDGVEAGGVAPGALRVVEGGPELAHAVVGQLGDRPRRGLLEEGRDARAPGRCHASSAHTLGRRRPQPSRPPAAQGTTAAAARAAPRAPLHPARLRQGPQPPGRSWAASLRRGRRRGGAGLRPARRRPGRRPSRTDTGPGCPPPGCRRRGSPGRAGRRRAVSRTTGSRTQPASPTAGTASPLPPPSSCAPATRATEVVHPVTRHAAASAMRAKPSRANPNSAAAPRAMPRLEARHARRPGAMASPAATGARRPTLAASTCHAAQPRPTPTAPPTSTPSPRRRPRSSATTQASAPQASPGQEAASSTA